MAELRSHRRASALHPVALACLVGAGTLAGAGLVTFQDARGLSYLSDDPAACANCHVMREVYDGWLKGPHHAVAVCNDCHTPHDVAGKYWVKARNGWHHSSAFTLRDYPDTIRITPANARVLQDNCVRCHADVVAGIGATADEPADDVLCARCHARAGHGPIR
jgi:cytochrome c nitrite reductase small subunit